jgi:hypothetical protein
VGKKRMGGEFKSEVIYLAQRYALFIANVVQWLTLTCSSIMTEEKKQILVDHMKGVKASLRVVSADLLCV